MESFLYLDMYYDMLPARRSQDTKACRLLKLRKSKDALLEHSPSYRPMSHVLEGM